MPEYVKGSELNYNLAVLFPALSVGECLGPPDTRNPDLLAGGASPPLPRLNKIRFIIPSGDIYMIFDAATRFFGCRTATGDSTLNYNLS